MSAHLAAGALASGALTIGGAAAVLLVLGAVISVHRAANPGRQSAAGRSQRARRPAARKSLIVTAAKAAGVKVTGDHLPGALAELAGRAAGRTYRAGRRHGGRAAAAAGRRLAAVRAGLAPAAQPPADAPAAAGAIDEPGPAPAAPTAALAPASTAPAPAPTDKGAPMPNPIAPTRLTDTAGVPGDHQSVISRVAGFEPADDAELIRFMAGECAALCAYSDGLRELYETCTSGLGLDPSAVRGLADYADASSEAAQAMARAHHRFTAVYAEVRAAVAAGVVMPHKGRFFTGQSA